MEPTLRLRSSEVVRTRHFPADHWYHQANLVQPAQTAPYPHPAVKMGQTSPWVLSPRLSSLLSPRPLPPEHP